MNRRWHYAWVVLACAFLLQGVAAGTRNAFAVFLTPLAEEFGWSVNAISFAYALLFIPAIPFALAAGSVADAVGPRRVLLGGSALLALGMLLTSTVTQVWQFYLFYAVLVGGAGTVFMAILPVTVTRWFEHRRGTAVGVVFAANAVGTMVLAPLFGWSISSIGWLRSFWIIGGAVGVIGLLAANLLRSWPKDLGTTAYGETPAQGNRDAEVRSATVLTLRSVQDTHSFWFLIAIHGLGCLGHSVLLAHVVRLGLLKGIPGVLAAGLLSAAMGTSIISRLGMPILTERWGGRVTLALGFLLQGGAILMYLGADGVLTLYGTSILFGLGLGAEMTAFPIVNRQYYGADAPLNAIHAWQVAGAMTGMGLGGWLGGVLFDASGAYTWSIVMGATATLAALPLILALPGRRAPQPIIAPAVLP